jgi:hypothetical protein
MTGCRLQARPSSEFIDARAAPGPIRPRLHVHRVLFACGDKGQWRDRG